MLNFGANPNTPVTVRGRRNDGAPLSLYVARARALRLRDQHLRIQNDAGRRP
jgi:hypothetical protein